MSATSWVPPLVPLVFQSSSPWMPSSAVKYSVEPMPTTLPGFVSTTLSAGPGSMSSTRPVALPLFRQSSGPVSPSSARKKSEPLTFTNSLGSEPSLPGAMSSVNLVPAAVPSLCQSS